MTGRLLNTSLNAGEPGYGRIVGGEGIHFVLDDGRRLIDASNTAGPLGHAHPAIVEAIREAASAPAINEGWYWPERERAAEDLIEIAFAGEHDWVGAVRFFLSGSEANDLALSLCQALTGRAKLATRERAYHGMTGLARDMTVQPHWHGGLSYLAGGVKAPPRAVEVIQLPAPIGARFERQPAEHDLATAASDAAAQLAEAAAVIVDYTQGGIYHSRDYQDHVAAAARDAGALWIADEVVTGLGRTGGWFAFQAGSARPDLVTLGKPLAGGGAPVGAVVVSREVAMEMSQAAWQTYSTFRGHPLMVAATRAHLRVLVREQLIDRVRELDSALERHMRSIFDAHPSVTRIDGRGLHWTVELAGPDWRSWSGDVAQAPIASRVADRAADAGALIGTSGEQTSLFISPPLIITEQDLSSIIEALDHGLELADAEMERQAEVLTVRR